MKQKLTIGALAVSLLLTACGVLTQRPAPAPTPPALPDVPFDVVVCAVEPVGSNCPKPIAGAAVRVHLAEAVYETKTADTAGYVLFHVPASLVFTDLLIQADGYVDRVVSAFKPAVCSAGCHNVIALRPFLARPQAGETLPIYVDGEVFRRTDGSIFPWVGADAFRLLELELGGGDVDAFLTDLLTKPDGTTYAPGTGPNILRVFAMYSCQREGNRCRPDTGIGWLAPSEHANFYDGLGRLIDKVSARGFLVEITALADTQVLMPRAEDRRAHLEKVAGILAARARGTIEVANEPFKNLPGGGAEACALAQTIRGRGIPVASGHYDFDALQCAADYITYHHPRKEEWVRTSKDLQDIRDWAKRPVVGDEPTGFAEAPRGDSRSTSADDAAWFAAGCQLFGAGCTFHSDAGIQATALGPLQRRAAEAWFTAARWVPAAAQLAPYQRGDQASEAGVGNMPIRHDDGVELRSFCKAVDGREYCIQIRTRRGRAEPRDGWRIVAEPRRGLVELAR